MKKKKENKKTFKELWANTRYRAIIKLGMWFCFFFFFFIISLIVSLFNKGVDYSKKDNDTKEEEKVEPNI